VTYLLCTQQPWGIAVHSRVTHGGVPMVLHDAAPAAPHTRDLVDVVVEHNPRYVFFVHWSSRIPAEVHDHFECVNFHCAPLPFGRGGSPIENMIQRGFRDTIISAHRVTTEIDAGPIYATSAPVGLHGPRSQIIARFIEPISDMITQICATEPRPVDQLVASRFSRLNPSEFEMFWRVRGC
jgi:methionyl-tRNA formyltransferase